MQQRRYRPGDVLDDYCPRERRITDHAIVAMIDDHIKQTRCVVCDAEHEYKDGKVPPQRRKKPQAALFTQVLDGLSGPPPPARVAAQAAGHDTSTDLPGEPSDAGEVLVGQPEVAAVLAGSEEMDLGAEAPAPIVSAGRTATDNRVDPPPREDGPWRRQLIRAALPRPEGPQPPAARPIPEFTIRQPNSSRARHGRRRGDSGGSAQGGNGNHGPLRFGRSGQGHGQGGRRRRGRGGKKNN